MTPLPIASIIILRNRQRRGGVGNCDDLIDSIRRLGLISPICLRRDNTLIAGERRLFSMKKLGWTELVHGTHFVYRDEIDEFMAEAIELEENVKRRSLAWQEEVAAVARYHTRRSAANSDWSQELTAADLGLSQQTISRYILVADWAKKDASILESQKLSVAVNTVERARQRSQAIALENLFTEPTNDPRPDEEVPVPAREPERDGTRKDQTHGGSEAPRPAPSASPTRAPIVHGDSLDFFASYSGPRFSFVHCDFPYGIDFQDQPRMNALNKETYDDGLDVYKNLVEVLLPRLPIADNAHMMFWFSMKHFEYTKLSLLRLGWTLDPVPLIWYRSDGKGLIPDPNRRGRYVYETAFHCWRGDQKIVRPVNNVYAGPRGDVSHPSEKPRELLDHFFRMYIDKSSHVLDPTCGTGNSLIAAKRLGAAHILGLEKDEKFYNGALINWRDNAQDTEITL